MTPSRENESASGFLSESASLLKSSTLGCIGSFRLVSDKGTCHGISLVRTAITLSPTCFSTQRPVASTTASMCRRSFNSHRRTLQPHRAEDRGSRVTKTRAGWPGRRTKAHHRRNPSREPRYGGGLTEAEIPDEALGQRRPGTRGDHVACALTFFRGQYKFRLA
jgi:hypothetical protein